MVTTFMTHITPYDLDRKVFVYLPDDYKTSGSRSLRFCRIFSRHPFWGYLFP